MVARVLLLHLRRLFAGTNEAGASALSWSSWQGTMAGVSGVLRVGSTPWSMTVVSETGVSDFSQLRASSLSWSKVVAGALLSK